jgi:pseudouridine-5'-phosphate glycosidase
MVKILEATAAAAKVTRPSITLVILAGTAVATNRATTLAIPAVIGPGIRAAIAA